MCWASDLVNADLLRSNHKVDAELLLLTFKRILQLRITECLFHITRGRHSAEMILGVPRRQRVGAELLYPLVHREAPALRNTVCDAPPTSDAPPQRCAGTEFAAQLDPAQDVASRTDRRLPHNAQWRHETIDKRHSHRRNRVGCGSGIGLGHGPGQCSGSNTRSPRPTIAKRRHEWPRLYDRADRPQCPNHRPH